MRRQTVMDVTLHDSCEIELKNLSTSRYPTAWLVIDDTLGIWSDTSAASRQLGEKLTELADLLESFGR